MPNEQSKQSNQQQQHDDVFSIRSSQNFDDIHPQIKQQQQFQSQTPANLKASFDIPLAQQTPQTDFQQLYQDFYNNSNIEKQDKLKEKEKQSDLEAETPNQKLKNEIQPIHSSQEFQNINNEQQIQNQNESLLLKLKEEEFAKQKSSPQIQSNQDDFEIFEENEWTNQKQEEEKSDDNQKQVNQFDNELANQLQSQDQNESKKQNYFDDVCPNQQQGTDKNNQEFEDNFDSFFNNNPLNQGLQIQQQQLLPVQQIPDKTENQQIQFDDFEDMNDTSKYMTDSIGKFSIDKSNDNQMLRSSDIITSKEFKDFESYRSKDGNSPFASAKQSIDNKQSLDLLIKQSTESLLQQKQIEKQNIEGYFVKSETELPEQETEQEISAKSNVQLTTSTLPNYGNLLQSEIIFQQNEQVQNKKLATILEEQDQDLLNNQFNPKLNKQVESIYSQQIDQMNKLHKQQTNQFELLQQQFQQDQLIQSTQIKFTKQEIDQVQQNLSEQITELKVVVDNQLIDQKKQEKIIELTQKQSNLQLQQTSEKVQKQTDQLNKLENKITVFENEQFTSLENNINQLFTNLNRIQEDQNTYYQKSQQSTLTLSEVQNKQQVQVQKQMSDLQTQQQNFQEAIQTQASQLATLEQNLEKVKFSTERGDYPSQNYPDLQLKFDNLKQEMVEMQEKFYKSQTEFKQEIKIQVQTQNSIINSKYQSLQDELSEIKKIHSSLLDDISQIKQAELPNMMQLVKPPLQKTPSEISKTSDMKPQKDQIQYLNQKDQALYAKPFEEKPVNNARLGFTSLSPLLVTKGHNYDVPAFSLISSAKKNSYNNINAIDDYMQTITTKQAQEIKYNQPQHNENNQQLFQIPVDTSLQQNKPKYSGYTQISQKLQTTKLTKIKIPTDKGYHQQILSLFKTSVNFFKLDIQNFKNANLFETAVLFENYFIIVGIISEYGQLKTGYSDCLKLTLFASSKILTQPLKQLKITVNVPESFQQNIMLNPSFLKLDYLSHKDQLSQQIIVKGSKNLTIPLTISLNFIAPTTSKPYDLSIPLPLLSFKFSEYFEIENNWFNQQWQTLKNQQKFNQQTAIIMQSQPLTFSKTQLTNYISHFDYLKQFFPYLLSFTNKNIQKSNQKFVTAGKLFGFYLFLLKITIFPTNQIMFAIGLDPTQLGKVTQDIMEKYIHSLEFLLCEI